MIELVDSTMAFATHGEGLILLKHGIFTFGDTARTAYQRMIDLVTIAEKHLARQRVKVCRRLIQQAISARRTLNDSFIILDEAQNSSIPQMKMFLTRLGFRSKMVVTGDVTQVDLPPNTPSGLVHAKNILKPIQGIGIIYFNERDVVRHELVKDIVKAYDKGNHTHEQNTDSPSADS